MRKNQKKNSEKFTRGTDSQAREGRAKYSYGFAISRAFSIFSRCRRRQKMEGPLMKYLHRPRRELKARELTVSPASLQN